MSTAENGNGVHGPRTYVTSNGETLKLKGISPLLIAKLQSVGTLPDVPIRRMKLDIDGEEVYQEDPLSADDLQDDEEEKLWQKYVEERDAVLEKRNNGFMKAVFAKGVEADLSRLDEWRVEQEFFGLEVPTHPIDQKVEFIQTEAIGSSDDLVEIITGVLAQSGIPEEELVSVRSMFRSAIRPNSSGESIPAEGEVAVES